MEAVTILLIDNDTDDHEIFILALQEVDRGLNWITFESGTGAVEYLARNPSFLPAFIFIDMNMPLIDGRECLAMIKKMDHLAAVPVYIYSTAANPASIAEVKKMGAADFIIKPADYDHLVAILAGIVQRKN